MANFLGVSNVISRTAREEGDGTAYGDGDKKNGL